MWKRVDMLDIEPDSIFAFLNNDTKDHIIGRVVTSSSTSLKIFKVNASGEYTGEVIDFPDWITDNKYYIYNSLQQSADIVFGKNANIKELVAKGLATDEQFKEMTIRTTTLMAHGPSCYIMKYVPDFSQDTYDSLLAKAQEE